MSRDDSERAGFDDSHSRAAFESAGLDGVSAKLAALEGRIDERLRPIADADVAERDKVDRFLALCERIAEELNALGHGLHRLDYGGDQRFEHNTQTWGTEYWDRWPDGLQIELRPAGCRALWVIGPPRESRAADASADAD